VEIISYCDACFKGTSFDSSAEPGEVVCARCGSRRPVALTDSIRAQNVVDRCVL